MMHNTSINMDVSVLISVHRNPHTYLFLAVKHRYSTVRQDRYCYIIMYIQKLRIC